LAFARLGFPALDLFEAVAELRNRFAIRLALNTRHVISNGFQRHEPPKTGEPMEKQQLGEIVGAIICSWLLVQSVPKPSEKTVTTTRSRCATRYRSTAQDALSLFSGWGTAQLVKQKKLANLQRVFGVSFSQPKFQFHPAPPAAL
jgi:hypothetical protein